MSRWLSMYLAAAMAATPMAWARADIVVGIAGPMTGTDAAYGEEIRRGGEKAIEDVNAKGGLLGMNLRTVIGDDACDPARAVAVAKDLAAQKVSLVVGHVCSSASIPASVVYAASQIVEISPSTTNPDFTERGLTNVFRVCGRDDDQGPAAADYIALINKGVKRIAIVDDKQTYGKGLAMAFKAAIEAKGFNPVAYEEIDPGQKEFGDLIARLKSAGAQYVYFGGYYTEAGLIVRQSREQGLKALLIGGDGLNDPKFWETAGEAGEGTLMTFGADPKLDLANSDLVEYFSKQSFEPEGYTFYAYAAVQVWAETVGRLKTLDPAKVATGLRTFRFQTAAGTLKFNSKGDRAGRTFVMYVWHNGQPVYARRQD